MVKKIAFDEVSAERIAKAVRKTESLIVTNPSIETHETHQEIPSLNPYALDSNGNAVSDGLVLTAKSDTDTEAPTPKPLIAKWAPWYDGEWAVSYAPPVSPSVLSVTLNVKKGHFNFGIYRSIASSDYTLVAPSSAGDYVIVAIGYSGVTLLPIVKAITINTFISSQYRYGYHGLAGREIIAHATVVNTGGVYHWTSLVQAHFGEISGDRYDPRSLYGSGTGRCAQIYYSSSNIVTVESQLVQNHIAGGGAGGYSMFSASVITVTVTGNTIIHLIESPTLSGGVNPPILAAISGPLYSREADNQRAVPLWELNVDSDGVAYVEGHVHSGVVNIWGDTFFT